MCSSSTSKPSSTTHTSSTASIVLLAEGEAATSLALQSTVLSVQGSKGGKLFVGQDVATECASLGASISSAPNSTMLVPVPADPVPADPVPADLPAVPDSADAAPVPADGSRAYPSQCYGFVHEDGEFCSNEWVWNWKRGPVPPWWSPNVPAVSITAGCTSLSFPDAPVAAKCAMPGAKSIAARGRNAPVSPVPAAECALPGAKLLAARCAPVAIAAECALPGANSLAARSRNALVLSAPDVPAAVECALPGAKLLAARGRPVPISAAAECALPGRSYSLLEVAMPLCRLLLSLLPKVRCRERS